MQVSIFFWSFTYPSNLYMNMSLMDNLFYWFTELHDLQVLTTWFVDSLSEAVTSLWNRWRRLRCHRFGPCIYSMAEEDDGLSNYELAIPKGRIAFSVCLWRRFILFFCLGSFSFSFSYYFNSFAVGDFSVQFFFH